MNKRGTQPIGMLIKNQQKQLLLSFNDYMIPRCEYIDILPEMLTDSIRKCVQINLFAVIKLESRRGIKSIKYSRHNIGNLLGKRRHCNSLTKGAELCEREEFIFCKLSN